MDSFEVNNTIWGASVRGDLERLQEIFNDPQERGLEQLNERNEHGYTPIHAANFSTPEVVKFLLERGADPNVSDTMQRTPLSDALHQGSEESAIILIQYEADVNCIDKWGETPLHIAVRKCSLRVVKLLWSNSSQRTLRNHKGESPLDIARERDDREILEFLHSEES